MEPIWGSFDANGNPLMIPMDKEFVTSSVDPQQQPQSGHEILVHPTSAQLTNPSDVYSTSSAPHESFASGRSPNPDSILGIYVEHLAARTILENNIDNSSSILFDVNNPEAPTLQHWESLQNTWGHRNAYGGAVTLPPANSGPNHEEQFGGPAQTPNQHYAFQERFDYQQAWTYSAEELDAFEPSIQNNFSLYEATPATSSLGDHSDASSYYSQASSQSLSRPATILQEPEQTKSGLFQKMLRSVDDKAHDCALCGKRFTRQSSLRTHSYSHTGEKPFKCATEGCGKEFSVSSNLRRHRKVHRSEHQELYESEQLSASSIIASSASSLVNSFHSSHGRNSFQNFFSRRSSMNFGTSSREISPPPGRRGPLDEAGRAALRAVRAVSACWRCKVLRKKCDPEKPCKTCPKKKESYWHGIGCRRGAIGSETEPIVMCPQSDRSILLPSPYSSALDYPQISNEILRRNKREQERVLNMLEKLVEIRATDDIDRLAERETIENNLKITTTHGGSTLLPILKTMFPSSPLETPLRACILAIMWEVTEGYEKPVFKPKSLLVLLDSAASYQSTSPGDGLISESLTCLRTCLEGIRTQRRDYHKEHHETCNSNFCRVDYCTNIDLSLKMYLDELSRVIFRKENLQSDRRWWLSVFYSLVIQHYVRILLISIVRDFANGLSKDKLQAPERYLHLAVKLFFASSAGYDPIVTDYSRDDCEVNQFELPQAAVGQYYWAKFGIHSSRDYVFSLFDIDRTFDIEEECARVETG